MGSRPTHQALLSAITLSLALAGPTAAAQGVAPPEVLDLEQTAVLLRVDPELVRELAQAQRIPARRIGESWRFSRAALLDWLKGDPMLAPATSSAPGNSAGAALAAAGLAALSARGTAADRAPRLAQATARPEAGAPAPTVGERPTTPTAEEVALRDQRALLKRAAVTVDLGLSYGYAEQAFPGIRQEQRALGVNTAIRYGLRDGLQATLRVPGVGRRTKVYTDASIGGNASPVSASDRYVGDATLSLLGVALREDVGRPNVVFNLEAILPSGPGDRGLGGGLVLSKSYDPAVVFAGASYLHGYGADAAHPRRSLARHNLGLTMGYTYAVNDWLALSSVFAASARNTASADGVSIPPPSERYQLQFGLTWLLARGLFVEPAVAMRLGASAEPTVSINLARTF